MSPQVEDFPPCSSCGGKLFPIVLCESCGAASILHNARQLDWAAACPECGTFSPWQVICDQCHSRFPAPGSPPTAPRKAEESLAEPATPQPPRPAVAAAPVPEGRRKRKLRGDVDTAGMLATLRAFGLDPSRAQALVDRGYNALWKIARVKESDLARIPEVGPLAARKIFASFNLLNYAPPQRTKELVAQDEYECPLCRCLTSAYAPSCPECGASFDEEEMDEAIRRAFLDEGIAGLIAFYDNRLAQKPDDADLLYARGLLLDSFGRTDEALESLERAASKAPDERKFKVALLRIQAKHARKPEWSEKLRTTASSLLDDVAWDQEVAELDDLITRAGPACTQCGRPLPEGAERCPSCGASVPPPEGAPAPREVHPSAQAPELDNLVDDLLVGELEESLSTEELERTKAAVLDWLIEELEESMRPDEKILPEAEKPEGEKAAATPSPLATSVGFLSGWMRGSRGLVSGMRPKREGRGTAGKVNGLVNGMGRVNGLVNGTGRVNGLVQPAGRVNGLVTAQGRVNGIVGAQGRINGIVNGTQFVRSGRAAVRLVGPSRGVRYAAIASGSLVAIVIFALLFIPFSGPTTPIAIDGSFTDWDAVPKLNAATVASNPYVSIAQYASLLDQASLYLYARTLGGTFGDTIGYDGMYFLIDADGNASTGFSFNGLGADSVVDVFGGNSSVGGARLYSFPPDSELNWSRRQPGPSVASAASSSGLELRVSTYDINGFNKTTFRVGVYADDFRGASSRSFALLSGDEGAIVANLIPIASTVGSSPTSLFEIRLQALGIGTSESWTVSSFQINATSGIAVSLSAESVTLTGGQPGATITASVSAPGFLPGDIVQVDVLAASGTRPVSVHGGPVRAYVVAPPSSIRIDGLFADWVGRDTPDSDATSVTDVDVNMIRSGSAASGSTVFFHVVVAGDLLAGHVPERVIRSPLGPGNASGGPPIPLPRQTGEDILRVYIDLNASNTQGSLFGGIYADYMFEVRGHGGMITGRSLFRWTGIWTTVLFPVSSLEKDMIQIEGSVAGLAVTNNTEVVFASTDWAGTGDTTPPIGSPSFVRPASVAVVATGAPALIIQSGSNPLTAHATALAGTPTIDGDCGTSSGEYAGAEVASNTNLRFLVGSRADTSFVYLCLEVTSDSSNDGASDWGELLFDPALNGGAAPQTDDRRFVVTGNSSTLVSYEGTGSAWVSCGGDCNAGNSARGRLNGSGVEVYEFKIRFSDIWGSDTPASNAVAGFAIVAHDNTPPADYKWGADNVSDTSPDTWGFIQIPEFHELALPVVGVLVIGLLFGRTRRRRR